MNFLNFGTGALLAGIAALAAGLYFLQRLRVRHREVVVPTMLFWQKALEESRARILVRRFRHPWAYVFLAIMAAGLWTLVGDPRRDTSNDLRRIYVVDASAESAGGGRFARALDLLEERIGSSEGAEVILAGARPKTVLLADESPRILFDRKSRLSPDATPCAIDATVHEILKASGGRDLELTVIAPRALSEFVKKSAPTNAKVVEVPSERTADAENPFGITALGVGEAASGDWTKVDVLCEIKAAGLPGVFSATINQSPIGTSPRVEATGDRISVLWTNVPATGGRLDLRGPRDDFPFDDEASIILPARTRLRVSLASGIDPLVRPVLEADTAVEIVTADADLDIVDGAVAAEPTRPTLAFCPSRPGDVDFLIESADDPTALMRVFRGIDRETIARLPTDGAAGLPQAIRADAKMKSSGARTIRVSRDLLGDGTTFLKVDAWPVFIAQSIRWLAGVPDLLQDVRPGRPLAGVRAALVEFDDLKVHAAAGDAVTLPTAGSFARADGETSQGPPEVVLATGLVDPMATRSFSRGPVPPRGDAASTSSSAWSSPAILSSIIGLLLFFGLLTEWVLVRKGRMP